jgi:hypothetical protein
MVRITQDDFSNLLDVRLGEPVSYRACKFCTNPPWLPEVIAIMQTYISNRSMTTAEPYFGALARVQEFARQRDARYKLSLREVHDHFFRHIVENQFIVPWLSQMAIVL